TDSGDTWAPVPAHLGTDSGPPGHRFRSTWAPIPAHLGTERRLRRTQGAPRRAEPAREPDERATTGWRTTPRDDDHRGHRPGMHRHGMRKIREVLRLSFENGCSQRAIAAATRMSKGSVGDTLRRAQGAGLTWDIARELTDEELERRLYPSTRSEQPSARVPVDFAVVHRELRRKGVTLQLLWLEYCEAAKADPERREPYQYSQVCHLHRAFAKKVDATMRQVHRAGEKAFIDYSGVKLSYLDRDLDERVEVELFVAVLGASNYTYAEATRTQKIADFCAS